MHHLPLISLIKLARKAQQDHEQKHDVQLEIPKMGLDLYPFSSPRGVPFDNESSESRQEDSRGDSLPLFLPPLESEDK